MQTVIHISKTGEPPQPVAATLFDFAVGGQVFQMAVHLTDGKPGNDWSVTHVASGRRACRFDDAACQTQIAIWGPEHGPVASALAALDTLVSRLGPARVRAVLAAAKPLFV